MRRTLSKLSATAIAFTLSACGGGSGGQAPVPTASCGSYPAQATSPYVLPYEVGSSYRVSQGNCSDGSHRSGTPDQYGYDFVMPIGTVLIAARDGTVTRIVDTFMDATGGVGTLPVTFANTDPHPNGLVAGRFYPAR